MGAVTAFIIGIAKRKRYLYTGKVSRSDIGMTVDATGTIKPVNSVKLSATASGTLEHVYVKQNETVTKGQILATIESKSLTSTMEQAKIHWRIKGHITIA